MARTRICAGAFGIALGLLATPSIAQAQSVGSDGTADLSPFSFYGQFNPAYQSVDDGIGTTGTLVDNSSSNSRIGLTYRQAFGENELRFNFETALGLRQSASVSQELEPDGFDWDRTDIRKVEFIWSAGYGTVYLGQGSMATDGLAGFDASGTTLATSSAIADFAGSFQFRDTAGALSGIEIGDVFKNLDGARRTRLRYDTPSFSGFSFQVAYGQEVLNSGDDADYYDAGVVYRGDFGGTEVEAGLGWASKREPGSENNDQIVGSVSVLLRSGLNLAFATGQEQQGGDGSYVYGKVGYLADFWNVGPTRFSVDYNRARDFVSVGSRGTAIGIGAVQSFDDQNLEAYVGYVQYELDDTSGTAYQDLGSVLLGARWRF